jgi:hypothetical protein
MFTITNNPIYGNGIGNSLQMFMYNATYDTDTIPATIINTYTTPPSIFTNLSSDAKNNVSAIYALYALNLSPVLLGSSFASIREKVIQININDVFTDIWADNSGILYVDPVQQKCLVNVIKLNSYPITIWYDQSGNNNHATQTSSAYQPKISLDINGFFQVDFTYITNGTGTGNYPYFNIPVNTIPMQKSYSVIIHHNTIQDTGSGCGFCGAGTQGNINIQSQNNFKMITNPLGFVYYNDWYYNGVASPSYSQNNIVSWIYDTISKKLVFYKNGTLINNYTHTNWSGEATPGYIGNDAMYPSHPLNGQLYSLVIFNTNLNDVDRQILENIPLIKQPIYN